MLAFFLSSFWEGTRTRPGSPPLHWLDLHWGKPQSIGGIIEPVAFDLLLFVRVVPHSGSCHYGLVCLGSHYH